jgi:hypothetical protein
MRNEARPARSKVLLDDREELARCRFHSITGIRRPRSKKERYQVEVLFKRWRKGR